MCCIYSHNKIKEYETEYKKQSRKSYGSPQLQAWIRLNAPAGCCRLHRKETSRYLANDGTYSILLPRAKCWKLWFKKLAVWFPYNPNNPVFHSKRDRWLFDKISNLYYDGTGANTGKFVWLLETSQRLHVLSGREYGRYWRNPENKFHGYFQNDKIY